MALWDKISSRGNIEDRRGMGPGLIGGGLSLTGLAIVMLFTFLGGGDVSDVVTQLQNTPASVGSTYNAKDFEGKDSYEVFASTVLGSNNELWTKIFNSNNITYRDPTLVLFRGSTESQCGGADSASGPHYCPIDETIYLDETFFDELTKRFGAKGGDVAEAYVISHEVGHHVQNVLRGLNPNSSNEESIKTELQADCLAGVWAYSIKGLGVFEPGEIQEAIDAASAVGDDLIQTKTTGKINPETWTHGSSAERVASFNLGYETGLPTQCGL
jgi:uncharacterized protein